MNNNNQLSQPYYNHVLPTVRLVESTNNSNYNLRQKLAHNYLQDNYDKSKCNDFSFCLFFLGWPYLIYRKQYKEGIFYMLFSLFLIISLKLFSFYFYDYSLLQSNSSYYDSSGLFYFAMKISLINLSIIYLTKHSILCLIFNRKYYDNVQKETHQLIKKNPNATEQELTTMVTSLGHPDKLAIAYFIIYILIIAILFII